MFKKGRKTNGMMRKILAICIIISFISSAIMILMNVRAKSKKIFFKWAKV